MSGATTEDLLPEFHWRAGRFAPDVVFVMFGTNDILAGDDGVRAFRYRLDQIVQRSRDVGATVVLQTPPPVLEDGGRGPRLIALYAEAVREVARDLGVLVVDHAAAWESAASAAGEDVAPAGWLDDTFHPGARGHHEPRPDPPVDHRHRRLDERGLLPRRRRHRGRPRLTLRPTVPPPPHDLRRRRHP